MRPLENIGTGAYASSPNVKHKGDMFETNRRKGHIGPDCWHKTRNRSRHKHCRTTYSGKEAGSFIFGIPKALKINMSYGHQTKEGRSKRI
eukprot:6153310-Heterocapsa_arctica.AAC.1